MGSGARQGNTSENTTLPHRPHGVSIYGWTLSANSVHLYMDTFIKKTEKDLTNLKGLKRPTKKVVITRDAEGKVDGIDLLPLWRFLMREAEGNG